MSVIILLNKSKSNAYQKLGTLSKGLKDKSLFSFSTIIAAMIKPHQWILFAMNLAVDMWTEDYYEFLSQLDGEYE